MKKKEQPFRAAWACVLGRPNVGKSTLVNRLVGSKVSIVTPKPQTTRQRVLGVKTDKNRQIVFVDTPGYTHPKDDLENYLVKTAKEEARAAEVILFLVDAQAPDKPDDERVLEYIKSFAAKDGIPVLLLINKVDLLADKALLLPIIERYRQQYDFAAVLPVSAVKGSNLKELETEIMKFAQIHPAYFPPEMLSDQDEEMAAGESIREKAFLLLRQELPYGVAVKVEEMRDGSTPGTVYIAATIYVEREAHKGMVIGKGGAMLKKIGQTARAELERKLGKKAFLDLRVKTKADWRERKDFLKTLGYW